MFSINPMQINLATQMSPPKTNRETLFGLKRTRDYLRGTQVVWFEVWGITHTEKDAERDAWPSFSKTIAQKKTKKKQPPQKTTTW